MKLVANKPCNLNGKKYFIGEEVPVEEVVDYASLVKMGLLSVIHDAVPEDNLEECVAMVGEVSFTVPIVKGHETIDLDVTEPQMQDAVKTMQMSADAAVAHIRGNIEDDTTLIIINALDSRATVKKAAESINMEYGEGTASYVIKDQYYNMKERQKLLLSRKKVQVMPDGRNLYI